MYLGRPGLFCSMKHPPWMHHSNVPVGRRGNEALPISMQSMCVPPSTHVSRFDVRHWGPGASPVYTSIYCTYQAHPEVLQLQCPAAAARIGCGNRAKDRKESSIAPSIHRPSPPELPLPSSAQPSSTRNCSLSPTNTDPAAAIYSNRQPFPLLLLPTFFFSF